MEAPQRKDGDIRINWHSCAYLDIVQVGPALLCVYSCAVSLEIGALGAMDEKENIAANSPSRFDRTF